MSLINYFLLWFIKFKHWKRAKRKGKVCDHPTTPNHPNWIWLNQYSQAPLMQWAHNSRPQVNRPNSQTSTLAFTSKTWHAIYTLPSCQTSLTTTWGVQMTKQQWLELYWGVSMEAKSTFKRVFHARSHLTRTAVSSPTLSLLSECLNSIAK